MLNTILDKLPPGPTMFFGAIYVIMPILPEPHLVQKAMMLSQGLALAPIDWLDIVMHSSGGLLALAVYRRGRQRAAEAQNSPKSSTSSEDEQA